MLNRLPLQDSPLPPRKKSASFFPATLLTFLVLASIATAEIPVIKSVLYVGDSITKHGPAEKLGWKSNWGMAATTEANDYVHQFSAKLAKAQGFEVETIVNGVGGGTIDGKLAAGDSLSKIKADLIVIQLGENDKVSTLEGFEVPYEKLVQLLKSANPSAKILCLGTWSPPKGSVLKDRMIRNVCARNRIPYADLAEANADPKGAAKVTGLWEHPGVGWHPSDVGMAGYAAALWKALNLGDKAIPALETAQIAPLVKAPIFTESFEIKEISQLKWKPAAGNLEPSETGQGLSLTTSDPAKSVYLRVEIDPLQIKGKPVVLSARVRGDHLSEKGKSYHGVKFGLDFLDAEGHQDHPQAPCETGTFGWKTIRREIQVPDNLVKASILIGLEQVTGTVAFDEILLEEAGSLPTPTSAPAAKVP